MYLTVQRLFIDFSLPPPSPVFMLHADTGATGSERRQTDSNNGLIAIMDRQQYWMFPESTYHSWKHCAAWQQTRKPLDW